MKHKLIASCLVLTLLFGGATFSSASVTSVQVEENQLVLSDLNYDDNMETRIWATVGKAAVLGGAELVGRLVGKQVARSVLGSSTSPSTTYDYEDIKVSFDH